MADEVGLGQLFDRIFSSAEIGHLKSENEFWKYVEKKLERNLDDIVVWDSDKKNVDKASELGMKSCLFTDVKDFRKKMDELLCQNEVEREGRKLA